MNRFFIYLEKYRYGILAVIATYIALFMYLQVESYDQVYSIDVWDKRAELISDKQEIEIKKENIEVNSKIDDVKNVSRDVNDDREKSKTDWSENKATVKKTDDIEKSIKELEEKYYSETGESVKREEILASKKEKLKEGLKVNKDVVAAKVGGDKVFSGNVMVEWSLSNRSPHMNDNWNVRNPGYTCGQGSSGVVTLKIIVDQSGKVLNVIYIPGSSSSANSCMIEQAKKYARMSKFAYSGNAPSSQDGTIKYTFVSQ